MVKKRVVIIGSSPIPIENTTQLFAPGIRSWHFAKVAEEANYDVMLIGCRVQKSVSKDEPAEKLKKIHNIEYYSVEPHLFEDGAWLKEKILQYHPNCIVGVNVYPSSILSDLDLSLPFWADLNGSAMAEAQAKSFVYDDNSYLNHFFQMELKILKKADVFSVVSEAQGFSTVGELGFTGRLSKETMGYRFVRVIPNTATTEEHKHTKNVIRDVLAKDSDFVVLYSGGYNTWTDVDTLFYGIEKAMSKIPNLIFVSTGGQIKGHDEYTFNHFRKLVENSKHKTRFHFCGWVPYEDLPNYYLEADLGINSDKYCYEAILGARTRILDWISASLPLISTPLSEITEYLVHNDLAYKFNQGDHDNLANQLIRIVSNKEDLAEKKIKLRKFLESEFRAEYTFREFKEWLKKPQFAPDHGKYVPLPLATNLENQINQPSNISQQIAISIWPHASNILRRLGLKKYEEDIKNFGYNLAFKNKQKWYRVKFFDIKLPQIEQGEKYFVPITIQNVGKKKWQTPISTLDPVNISYIWKDLNGKIVLRTEERTPLPRIVKPRQKIKLEIGLTAPPKEGTYILEIDLLKENQFWFSELDSEPLRITTTVKKKEESITAFPKVSIIIVTYNSTKYISECLNSILQSDYPSYEIIVVENASTDNTTEILKNYEKDVKIIKSHKNLGFAGGNNLGIYNSKGQIIILINPDAFVKKDSIRQMVTPFLKDEKVMVTGPKIFYPGTNTIQSAGGIIRTNALPLHFGYGKEDSPEFDFPREVDYVTGAAMAVSRKLFERTGLFDLIYSPAYYEETEKCVRARKLGYKIVYVPKSIVYHHESTTLTALSENYLKPFHTNRFRFIYRNYNFKEFLKFIPSELKWFFINSGSKEKNIVVKAHLKSLFSPQIRFRKKIILK